jgi:hypothetical protein
MDAGSLLPKTPLHPAAALEIKRRFKSASSTDPLIRFTEFGERMTLSENPLMNVPPVSYVLGMYAEAL